MLESEQNGELNYPEGSWSILAIRVRLVGGKEYPVSKYAYFYQIKT